MSDIQLFYREEGAGMPLVFLHGNGDSGEYFDAQMAYFRDTYRVIVPDTRGHGRSPRGVMPFTLSQFADDLADFFDGRGIKRAHIFGFSDGANIAMLFALRYPERVEKLILCGGNADPSGIVPDLKQEIHDILARAEREGDTHTAELMRLMTDEPNLTPDDLSRIPHKTLVLAGTEDAIPRGHTEMIAASIPNATLRFVEGTHFIARERAEEVNALVGEFLQMRNSEL